MLDKVSYTFNGQASVKLCSNGACGSTYDLAGIGSLVLGACENTLIITATDDQGLKTIKTFTIRGDGAPPVLTCKPDKTEECDSGGGRLLPGGFEVVHAFTGADGAHP